MLFPFAFNETLAEFTIMLWVIILHEYKSLTYKLHSRRDRVMLQYAMIASLIQFALHPVQIPDFAIGKRSYNLTESSPCFTVDVIQEVVALSSTLCHT